MTIEFTEFTQRVNKAIDFLSPEELRNLREGMEKKDCINKDSNKDDADVIRKGLSVISIDDLETIAPSAIKMLISELTTAELNVPSVNTEESKPQTTTDETEESLVQEAVKILAQRQKPGAEIPRDLQPRMAYIFAKLHHKFFISYREIERQIALSRQTIANYSNKFEDDQPDTVKMWIQSVENKVSSKVEETLGKQASARAIETLKGNIILGDVIREKYSGIASSRGYNLFDQRHLEKVIKEGVSLFFSIDGIENAIIKIEKENEYLRIQNISQKRTISELNSQILILTEV